MKKKTSSKTKITPRKKAAPKAIKKVIKKAPKKAPAKKASSKSKKKAPQLTGNYKTLYKKVNLHKRNVKYKRGSISLASHAICPLPEIGRKDEATLSNQEKDDFNRVIQALIDDGSYDDLVAFHRGSLVHEHMMHGFHGSDGRDRFLPWHRVYLFELEKLIANYDSNIKIPYWNWIENPQFPDWIILPTGVTRNIGAEGRIPSKRNICQLYNRENYIRFTEQLEDYHGNVHVFIGGTMRDPNGSPADPIFWLHHAFIDKIWNDWQQLYPDNFALTATRNVLNPWPNEISEVQDLHNFCTSYPGLETCLNEISDDNTRDIVNARSCDELNAFTDDELIDLVNNMIDGFTGNADEQAILKIFNCVNCERLIEIVSVVGLDTLLSNFHGPEDRQLRIRLGICGIMSMAEWNDDTTRDFLDTLTCEGINDLTNSQIRDLVNNMLQGATYNADERAILRIFSCISCDRLSQIVRLVGQSRLLSDFHGAEDRQLRIRLGTCGIMSMASWDDDTSRDFVNNLTCAQTTALSNNQLRDLINNMLDGATLNADERAILRILRCLDCARLEEIVDLVGMDRLLSDFHGAEDTELRVILGKCGLIAMSTWDDDATRAFVNSINCTDINAFTDNTLRELINNMLQGNTANADERAILKILRCLECSRRRSVVTLVGRRRLLSNLHGAEDDQLRALFRECDI